MSFQGPEHLFGVTYSPPKRGKTLAAIRAFPDGLFIGLRGSFGCSSWIDWEVKSIEVPTDKGFEFCTSALQRARGKFSAIVVDELSLISDGELLRCRGEVKGYGANGLFNQRMYQMRDAARNAGCHVIFIAHETAPRQVHKGESDKIGRLVTGGPLLSGWQATEKLPAMADFVARITHNDEADENEWPYIYSTEPDPFYVTGGRLDVFPRRFPLNLREPILASGRNVPRPEALAWMDEQVHIVSSEVLSGKDRATVEHATAERLSSKYSPRHIRWVLADARDRVVLRQHLSNILNDFIDG